MRYFRFFSEGFVHYPFLLFFSATYHATVSWFWKWNTDVYLSFSPPRFWSYVRFYLNTNWSYVGSREGIGQLKAKMVFSFSIINILGVNIQEIIQKYFSEMYFSIFSMFEYVQQFIKFTTTRRGWTLIYHFTRLFIVWCKREAQISDSFL